jgi:hypothetical protein
VLIEELSNVGEGDPRQFHQDTLSRKVELFRQRRLSFSNRRGDIEPSEVLMADDERGPQRAPIGFAGLAIGLALTRIHLISIPVTNTSVNPARSTGPALFVGGWALQQLWLFWLAPVIGAAIAGFV